MRAPQPEGLPIKSGKDAATPAQAEGRYGLRAARMMLWRS